MANSLKSDHRIFVIGMAGTVGSTRTQVRKVSPYGFVAAFRESLRKGVRWGTDRFADPYLDRNSTGLERLREVDFGSDDWWCG